MGNDLGIHMANIVKSLSPYFSCKKEVCIEGTQRHLVGNVWYDKVRCERKTCMKGGRIQVETCPILREQPGCEVVQGRSEAKFPDCCDTLSCWRMVHSDPPDDLAK